MEEKLIRISLREYEGMKETIEILQDSDLMEQINDSEKNREKGKEIKKLGI